MRAKKPLYITLFIIDLLRLSALLTALSEYQNSTMEIGSLSSYAIVYAAPQALFVLMAFFLWRSPQRYAAFLPLYTAGKVISAFSVGVWLLKTLPSAEIALGLGKIGVLLLLGVSALIVMFDLLTALFGLLLLHGQRGEIGEATANAPDLVVESLDDESVGMN